MIQQQEASATWFGPLPPPGALKVFGEIDSTFPDRIMKMAEDAAEHQRSMERLAMAQQEADRVQLYRIKARAQWFAGSLAIFFGLVGGWMAYLGHSTASATVIGSVVVGLASVFLLGRRSEAEK